MVGWNQIKTLLLLASLGILLVVAGDLMGGQTGATIAFGIALVINFIAYWYSDRMVLAFYRAKPLDPTQFANIYDMVHDLTKRDNLPMPKLWFIPTPMPNAFATGRNPAHASVAVTQGIVKLLDEEELRAVLGHELSHVKNRDMLVVTIAATIAAAIGYLADMMRWSLWFGGSRNRRGGGNVFVIILSSILLPFAALLIQLAISRSREFLADECGARLSESPLALASALQKISGEAVTEHLEPQSYQEVAFASLMISNPFSAKGLFAWFSTHPPLKERVKRLQAMRF